LALIALALRLESKGPVLTRRRVADAWGRPVDLLAFRTTASDEPGADPRPTRIGQALRRTGLDELPRLWNVLRGDVGLGRAVTGQ
jgi:lipopolysaccharide/colanic/teichoic acid biosynthesis glycosyltransferase